MCNQAVDNYGLGLVFVPDCYKNHEKFDDAVNIFLFEIQFITECYMSQ